MNKGKISCEEYVRKRKEYKVCCEEEKKRDEKEEDTKINNKLMNQRKIHSKE